MEESLRDFIGKIITYYEKYNIDNSLLAKYEQKISNAETLLEVFDVMKEMFDELMDNVGKNKNDTLDCSEISNKEDKTLAWNFEVEIKIVISSQS